MSAAGKQKQSVPTSEQESVAEDESVVEQERRERSNVVSGKGQLEQRRR